MTEYNFIADLKFTAGTLALAKFQLNTFPLALPIPLALPLCTNREYLSQGS